MLRPHLQSTKLLFTPEIPTILAPPACHVPTCGILEHTCTPLVPPRTRWHQGSQQAIALRLTIIYPPFSHVVISLSHGLAARLTIPHPSPSPFPPFCPHLSRMTCVVGSRGGGSPAATASSRRMRDDGAQWCYGGSVPPFIFLSSNTQRMAATTTQSSSPQCRLRPRLRCITIRPS